MTTQLDKALNQLDEVDWTRFSHAYGSANDVPDLLRGWILGKPVGKKKRHIEDDLAQPVWGALFHQGGLESAVAPAVPVFVAVLLSPEHKRLWEDAAWFVASAAAPENAPWYLVHRFELRDHNVPAVHESVEKHVPELLSLLENPNYPPGVRRSVAGALAWCLTRTKRLLDTCEKLMDSEDDVDVRTALLLLSGILAARRTRPRLADWMVARGRTPRERLTAAVVHGLCGVLTDGEHRTLVEVIPTLDAGDPSPWNPFYLGSPDGLVGRKAGPSG